MFTPIDFQKDMRKSLQTLQPSCGGKENMVGTGRITQDATTVGKTAKQELLIPEVEIVVDEGGDDAESSSVPTVDPSLYKKLIIEDITSTAEPSEKYWKVIAERRRKALKEVIEENHRIRNVVVALEKENESCKKLLEETTDLVNILKEIIHESNLCSDNDENNSHSTPDSCSSDRHEFIDPDNDSEQLCPDNDDNSGCSTPDSWSTDRHVNKKMKMSNPDSCSSSDSEL